MCPCLPDNGVKDDQLRMMFSCCHPRLAEEVQVALVLNILCGFSVSEIASAFVSGEAAIEKRISRGKRYWRGRKHFLMSPAISLHACRLFSVRCTFSSTRAITAHHPRLPYA